MDMCLQISRTSKYGDDMRFEVFGSNGMISVYNPNSIPLNITTSDGISNTKYSHSFPQRFEQVRNQLLRFD